MDNYKSKITLNEKDSLTDILMAEKEGRRIFATAPELQYRIHLLLRSIIGKFDIINCYIFAPIVNSISILCR